MAIAGPGFPVDAPGAPPLVRGQPGRRRTWHAGRPMSKPPLPGIAAVAQQDPGRVALDLPGRAVTYGQLDVGADRLARRLLAETQPPGRRSLADGKHVAVPLLIAGAEELLVAVEAVRRAGMVTVPVD